MTRAVLALGAVLAMLIGVAIGSAGLMILALFALMVVLWMDAHDPARWEQP